MCSSLRDMFNPDVKCKELHSLSILAQTSICSYQGDYQNNHPGTAQPKPLLCLKSTCVSHHMGMALIAERVAPSDVMLLV